MFNWYRNYLVGRYLRKFERGIVGVDNYKYVGKLLNVLVSEVTYDMLPRTLSGLKTTMSSGNGIELLNTFKQGVMKLRKGESITIHYNRSAIRIGDWATDGLDKPLRLSVYLSELQANHIRLEALLDDVGSKSHTDLEFYVNTLASSFMDVVKISKILIRN